MDYEPMKDGALLRHEGVDYPQAQTAEQAIACVTLGDLLDVNDAFEVWIFSGQVVVIPNQIGILE